jgi:hypothetical protein
MVRLARRQTFFLDENFCGFGPCIVETFFVTQNIGVAINLSVGIAVISPRPGGIVGEFEMTIPRLRDFVKVHGSERSSLLYANV